MGVKHGSTKATLRKLKPLCWIPALVLTPRPFLPLIIYNIIASMLLFYWFLLWGSWKMNTKRTRSILSRKHPLSWAAPCSMSSLSLLWVETLSEEEGKYEHGAGFGQSKTFLEKSEKCIWQQKQARETQAQSTVVPVVTTLTWRKKTGQEGKTFDEVT